MQSRLTSDKNFPKARYASTGNPISLTVSVYLVSQIKFTSFLSTRGQSSLAFILSGRTLSRFEFAK